MIPFEDAFEYEQSFGDVPLDPATASRAEILAIPIASVVGVVNALTTLGRMYAGGPTAAAAYVRWLTDNDYITAYKVINDPDGVTATMLSARYALVKQAETQAAENAAKYKALVDANAAWAEKQAEIDAANKATWDAEQRAAAAASLVIAPVITVVESTRYVAPSTAPAPEIVRQSVVTVAPATRTTTLAPTPIPVPPKGSAPAPAPTARTGTGKAIVAPIHDGLATPAVVEVPVTGMSIGSTALVVGGFLALLVFVRREKGSFGGYSRSKRLTRRKKSTRRRIAR